MTAHTSSLNVQNALLAALVPLPSICFYLAMLRYSIPDVDGVGRDETFWNARWGALCKWGVRHPLGLLNVLFFLNVNLLFWFISFVQHSTWLIDLYWSILPVMITHYFSSHPLALYDQLRSKAVTLLVWIWSIRLTHSYFRRENWNWGEREDWRFSNLRKKHVKNWWWISFFIVYVSQQVGRFFWLASAFHCMQSIEANFHGLFGMLWQLASVFRVLQ
ncbi:hypothetical protein O6H91_03G088200 [Diphasiastrum complanatum]|uniref:Uncharacterized protein n=1 Tax=Diphasiastrum complanatum TaxID=34168 RepID=A0ACC2E8E9_DIPCM|nr:hypothetical protein O6H91_03G088200 [Diphasiastrum complanatum]